MHAPTDCPAHIRQPDALLAELLADLDPDDHTRMARLIHQAEVGAIAGDAINGRHLTYLALALTMLHAIAVLDYSPQRWRTAADLLYSLMRLLATDPPAAAPDPDRE